MPPPVDVLHAMFYEHYSGLILSGASAVGPRALYAFARGFQHFDDDEFRLFWSLSERQTATHDVVLAWLDAAERCFALDRRRASGPSDGDASFGAKTDARADRMFDLVYTPQGLQVALRSAAQ